MPTFRKKILQAGKYNVSRPDGSRSEELITVDRLNQWVKTFNTMKQAGLSIPGPTKHAQAAVPVVKGLSPEVDSFTNAGWWNNLWVVGDSLYGDIDAPGDINDPNTPAGKIGTVVKETSIFTLPEYMDGKGNKYNDPIVHIALVTHPIEPGQENFQPVEPVYGIAMSQYAGPLNPDIASGKPGNGDTGTPLSSAIKVLRECGLDVGEDATESNILERIIIAGRQKVLDQGSADNEASEDNPLTKPPENGKNQPVSVAMSQPTQPAQVSPEVVAQLTQQNAILMSMLQTQYSNTAQVRINSLIEKGVITAEYAAAELTPMLQGVQMSVNAQGSPEPTVLDRILGALEKLPAPAKQQQPSLANGFGMSISAPAGSVAHTNPAQGEISPQDANALANAMLKNAGFVRFAQ